MFVRLLLLFTAVPLIELALLLEIGKRAGLAATLALVLGTGFLGAYLARREGLRTLTRVREEMAAGRLPADALLDGLLILIAGAVLLTPGLLTDLTGFVLLIPASRRAIRRRVAARMRRGLETKDPRVIILDDRQQDRPGGR
jgi:UPF0716 protein FxsA